MTTTETSGTETSGTVTSADGARIAFAATGTGPALVIVDGAMSYRAFNPTGEAIAQALADRYTVVTYDRRGRGDSSDTDAYSVQAEVDDLAALIEQVGGEAAVLGFSSGAVLSLEAALAGLPITGLALYEAPFIVSADREPIAPDYRERLEQALAEGRPGDAAAQFLTEAVGMPAEFVEPMRAEPYWPAMEALARTLPYDATVMGQTMSGDPAALQRYAPVTTPTLVLHGGASQPVIAAAATAITEVLPNASRRMLPDQDHDVSADALVPVLAEWLPTLGR